MKTFVQRNRSGRNTYKAYSIIVDMALGWHWRREITTMKGIIMVAHCTGCHRQRRDGFIKFFLMNLFLGRQILGLLFAMALLNVPSSAGLGHQLSIVVK
jgi:hypothetical protein